MFKIPDYTSYQKTEQHYQYKSIGGVTMMTGFGMGFGVVGPLLMLLFWGGLIFGAVWIVRAVFQTGPSIRMGQIQNAGDILNQRYARGELTRDQYEGMRQDLET